MARKVTVTFDNGAQHTYEDVPDSATPDSVLERTRRDFGDRGVTNIDGGKEKGGLDYVMDFGKGAASLADTALNAVTGTLDYGAYALARAAGRSPEQAQAETTSPKDVIGGALGITQDPAYQQEASRRAMGAVGSGIEKYAVQPISSATGLPESDVANMVNTGMIAAAPAVARGAQATGRAAVGGAQAVGRGATEVAKAPVNFGRGFIEGVLNPEPTPNSAMVPLQKQAYPAQAGREFMAGNMTLPELEASRVPSSSLFSGRLDQTALKALPKNAEKQPMVPLAGRGMEAVGENLGRGYRTQPLQAAADLGLMSLGVPPIGPAARAAQGLASLRAGKAADFSPGFTQRLGQAQSQAALAPNPQLRLPPPGAPAAGPVAPATMYAGAGGVSADLPAAGRAALDVRYPPLPPVDNKAAVQAAAAARITPPTTDLQARAQAAFGSQYRPPVAAPVAPQTVPKPMVETPAPAVSGPVAPAAMPEPVATTPAPVVQSTMTPTTQHGQVPVTGKAYYEHYTAGGKTPRELQYSPGTLAEQLYNKVKQDPKSLTRQDIENWYASDQNTSNLPDFTAKKATKKSPGITEEQKVQQTSEQLARRIIQQYEQVNSQTSFGRPDIKGMTVEQATAFDRKRMQDQQDKIAKQNLEQSNQEKAAWDALTDKEKQKSLKAGGRNPYELDEFEGGVESTSASSKKKAPPGVIEMIVPDEAGTVYSSKAEFDKANLFKTLQSKAATGSYREGNKIITVTPYQGQWPLPPGRPAPTTTRAVDAVTGERVPVGKKWTADDPEPLSSRVRKKLKKD